MSGLVISIVSSSGDSGCSIVSSSGDSGCSIVSSSGCSVVSSSGDSEFSIELYISSTNSLVTSLNFSAASSVPSGAFLFMNSLNLLIIYGIFNVMKITF